MNRFNLVSACVLGLAACTLSAQEVKLNLPASKDAPAPAATTAPAAAATAPVAAPAAAPAPTFTEHQIMEEFGWFVGQRLGLTELGFNKEQTDSLVKGLLTAAEGKEAPYDLQAIGPQMEAFMQKKQEGYMTKMRDQNLAEAKTFFEQLKSNKKVVELPSGLRYEILQPGTGAYPKPTDTVEVHYTGRLLNGTVFDSSEQRGKPVDIQLDKVIPGWTEGLQKINKGGRIRLYVPPDLAYGDNGQGAIPPGATLVFDVQLLEINPPAAAAAPTTEKP